MRDAALILLPLVLAHFAAAVSPGPSFVLIARTSAARTRAAAMRMSVGLGLGAMLWAAAALFGLTLLFEIAPWTYLAMKVAGAGFLLWLGYQLWRHAPEPLDMTLAGQDGLSRTGDVRHGLLVQIANPKVSIFFGSVFVTLVPPDASVAFLAVLLALIFIVETAWYLAVSTFFAVPQIRARYLRLKAWIDRACGGVLGLLGLRLAIS
ncbi:LysE family transporter [Halovulum dunhuangense]|uniref:LysE family transporter n=1 Tax=Halovulum dunhuangense TaxID=1505036 RepID=A0A849L2M7_9RHOB|nr:LysE family transporter [Halovulum dunhuangense]NNU80490.1 LysE family transporter [Halovulum dunhuangense]